MTGETPRPRASLTWINHSVAILADEGGRQRLRERYSSRSFAVTWLTEDREVGGRSIAAIGSNVVELYLIRAMADAASAVRLPHHLSR